MLPRPGRTHPRPGSVSPLAPPRRYPARTTLSGLEVAERLLVDPGQR